MYSFKNKIECIVQFKIVKKGKLWNFIFACRRLTNATFDYDIIDYAIQGLQKLLGFKVAGGF